jgi:hypothetical protein
MNSMTEIDEYGRKHLIHHLKEAGMMGTPYIGFGQDQLDDALDAADGDEILCPKCGQGHVIRAAYATGEDGETKTDGFYLLFYKCGDKDYLAGVNGKLTMGIKPQVSGSLDLEKGGG